MILIYLHVYADLISPSPDVNGTENTISKIAMNQFAFVVSHGSRYPDQSAYNGWVTLHQKVHSSFNARQMSECLN